ncbi:type II toxin-antitoxin system VapC family toxin [Haloplanus rallus]|uniref:Type II toxin-antitoxin system VapC family toxin n=1 Tax=Haloplanus rallus TaxID=1816183 RepID=A0A6B9F8M4_9EURY|nr:PIN domain-containing protein [Haloplanus rallus]QGX94777.1 type II toxin-antitoxin system VapC family toxin [Haloplanus rallus]
MADAIAIDAEPLIAYYWDESGAEDVEAVIDDVERGNVHGWINSVTCTEVRYVCGRDDAENSRQYVNRIRDWFGVVTAEDVWERAAACKRKESIALGDAFTIATAIEKDAVAYCGADDDFDGIDVTVRRFRETGV